MDWELIAAEIGSLVGEGTIFLKTDLPIVDFTIPFPGVVQIYGSNKVVSLPLSNTEDLNTIGCLISHLLCDVMIISWDIKRLITYFKFHTPKIDFKLEGTVIDLMLWESFLGVKLNSPENLQQAKKRLQPGWKNDQLKMIHKKIHRPLALEVIPAMEIQGVQDTFLRRSVYPSYQIEGQVNGRLKCEESFPGCVNPHGMQDDTRSRLKLRDPDEMFIYYDYQSMEVVVLQYLSKDKKLAGIVENCPDIYKGIWFEMFGTVCQSDEQRLVIKESFLPVMYGMQSAGLAKKIDTSQHNAASLMSAYRKKFSEAFEWVDHFYKQQEADPKSPGKDFFGRVRYFEEPIAVRNFIVQAPAAIVCLEKLIDLYKIAGNRLVFTIHDGYVIRANPLQEKVLPYRCKELLEAPSVLAPGLRLRVDCEMGVRLDRLKRIEKKKI